MKNLFRIVLFSILFFAFSTVFGQWPKYTIDSYLYSAMIVDVVDIDNDSNPDAVVTGQNVNKVVWYKNPGQTSIK